MRSPYFTNTPGDQGVHRSQLDHRLYKGVNQGGVAISLTSHPSLSFHLSCLLVSPLMPTSPLVLLTFTKYTAAIVRGLASATILICGHLHLD